MADPKAYLKRLGMQFDVKPAQIDARFHKSLPEEQRGYLQKTRSAMSMGLASGVALYEIPQTQRQAALLFSHDAERYRQSLKWFEKVVAKLAPSSTFEVGCGAAFTSGFLRHRFPDLTVSGIEAHQNLAEIAEGQLNGDVIRGNYLEAAPTVRCDLIICDFGFDLTDFAPSNSPHSTAEHDEFSYCPGCKADLAPQLEARFAAWKGWLVSGGYIAIAGRFADFGMVSAAVEAAERCGMGLCLDLSTVLRVQTLNGLQRFPAMVFSGGVTSGEPLSLAAEIYRK